MKDIARSVTASASASATSMGRGFPPRRPNANGTLFNPHHASMARAAKAGPAS